MYIKCDMCDGCDNILLHLTPSDRFEFRCRSEDGLYLILSDKEIQLRDVYVLCQGRNLPAYAVDDLYTEIIETISKLISDNEKPDIIIDIDEIEGKLLAEKYEKLWADKGYIDISPDGSW